MEKIVKAFFCKKKIEDDPSFEIEFAKYLRQNFTTQERLDIFERFNGRNGKFDEIAKKILAKSIFKGFGNSVSVGASLSFSHPETIEIGNGVFIGRQTTIQGRLDGYCKIGNRVWIGPNCYFDARALIIEDNTGWGPGAKVLGSEHSGTPNNIPVIQTDLIIKPVKICQGCDVGTNAVILPGVTVGEGSVIGAGAVVTKDVEPYSVVAGVPARLLRKR